MAAATLAVAPLEGEQLLTRAEATKLQTRIQAAAQNAINSIAEVQELLAGAKAGQAHIALGYKDWTGWVADTLGGTLDIGEASRRNIIKLLSGEGMSVRAIGKAVGLGKSAVHEQLSGDRTVDQPEKVRGLDGIERRRPTPKPKPEPVAPLAPFIKPPTTQRGNAAVARRTMDHLTVTLDSVAGGLDDIAPSVDVAAHTNDIEIIRNAANSILAFVDSLSPPEPVTPEQDPLDVETVEDGAINLTVAEIIGEMEPSPLAAEVIAAAITALWGRSRDLPEGVTGWGAFQRDLLSAQCSRTGRPIADRFAERLETLIIEVEAVYGLSVLERAAFKKNKAIAKERSMVEMLGEELVKVAGRMLPKEPYVPPAVVEPELPNHYRFIGPCAIEAQLRNPVQALHDPATAKLFAAELKYRNDVRDDMIADLRKAADALEATNSKHRPVTKGVIDAPTPADDYDRALGKLEQLGAQLKVWAPVIAQHAGVDNADDLKFRLQEAIATLSLRTRELDDIVLWPQSNEPQPPYGWMLCQAEGIIDIVKGLHDPETAKWYGADVQQRKQIRQQLLDALRTAADTLETTYPQRRPRVADLRAEAVLGAAAEPQLTQGD